jgi:type IV secretory pathway TraG/TraD family ATPase VirD4
MTAAFCRRPHERTPFFVFIDEFSHFVTKDACEILDGGRKFGLHLILAHQHLGQLREKDPEVYYSTLTNARTKIVFGGLNDEDVDLIAKELFTGEFDPDEVKDEIWHRGFEPVESPHRQSLLFVRGRRRFVR